MEAGLIRIAGSAAELAAEAAAHVERAAAEAVRGRGRFTLALSGGSTPRALYSLLAGEPFRSRLPWRETYFFWGDERCVGPDDARSNYKAAWEALIGHIDVPPRNVHPVRVANGTPEQAAAEYEKEICSAFGVTRGETPRFDLVLLGLGADGHTASLFPGTPSVKETGRLVTSSIAPDGMPRVTFTFPLINAARRVAFLVAGADKAKVAGEAARGEGGHPAALVRPSDGELAWFVDADAGRLLE